MKLKPIVIACLLAIGASGNAFAADSAEVQAIKQQMQAMQKQMLEMQQKLESMSTAQAQAPTIKPASSDSPLSARIGGAEVTLYGYLDASVDAGTDGKQNVQQASSNLSYLGVRGSRELGSSGLKGIFQIETLVPLTSTPTETSALGSRNTFVGIEGSAGKFMVGKYDTPYKRSTASMDPFASSVADYNTIMGNTGGDLRAEFDARMPHSIFYDSPKFNGFSVYALYSPGQKFGNLAGSDKYAFAQGEKVCAGATPGSSGSTPDGIACEDGAFTNVYSLALNYENGPFFGTLAWERHKAVDRTSDTGGVVSNESAFKVGGSYLFNGGNKFSAIYERFSRGGINPAVNERARNGYYLSDVQDIGHGMELMAAWAHAGQTPGGPDFGTVSDKANMYALGWKYHYDKQTSVYVVGAMLKQDAGAHYALGAGGHGTAIASPRDDAGDTIPGKSIKAVSVGMQYGF